MKRTILSQTSLYSFLVATLCITGCATMVPEYKQPVAPVTSYWPNTPNNQIKDDKHDQKMLSEIPWRDFFVNEQLKKIIEMALDNNRDLRIATLNIERFRAMYQIQRTGLLPKADLSAGAGFQRIPEDLSPSGHSKTTHQYDVGFGLVSYELDLFGRIRSLKDQALEQYLATEQARQSVQLTIVSQVATSYLTLAADRERLKLAKETLTSQQGSLHLIERRFEAGVSSSLDLQQARISVEAARVDIANYTAVVAQDENALNLLVGADVPADLLQMSLAETFVPIKGVSPGLPSDVLLRRPDIIQAESQLKAANANIGAAQAAFFPRITLVSSIGLGSDELAGLFKGGALAWSIAPRISLPIFDAGSNKANLKVSEVDHDIMVVRYEKTIKTAFREVADALAKRSTIDELLAAQQSLVSSASERYALSQARFDKGVDSHLNVLDSQRSLYGARQNLISARLSLLENQITLYKALGGGWK